LFDLIPGGTKAVPVKRIGYRNEFRMMGGELRPSEILLGDGTYDASFDFDHGRLMHVKE
jgi:hypothetical protein